MNKFLDSPLIRAGAFRLLDAQKEGIHNMIRHANGRRLTDAEIAETANALMAAVVDDVIENEVDWDDE